MGYGVSRQRIYASLLALGAGFLLYRTITLISQGALDIFDVRPEYHAEHSETWTWAGVYFAAIMSVLGVIGVIIIWILIRRAKKN